MIHQLTPSCIAVKVPEDASGFLVSNAQLDNDLVYLKDGSYKYIASLPGEIGNWKILGRGNDLTEEQWKEIVKPVKTFGYPSHKQIMGGSYQWYATALKSGLSLLKSKGLNPDVLILIKDKQ